MASSTRVHPYEHLLQKGSVPSVWCPGCGIGTVLNTFVQALRKSGITSDTLQVVSGSGCAGKIAECMNVPAKQMSTMSAMAYLHTMKHTDATRVVMFMDNVDVLVSGAREFVLAGEEPCAIVMIYINNIFYTVTEQGAYPITPFMRVSAKRDFELPFNIPHVARSCGARYIARWTPLHVRNLLLSMIDALQKKTFSVIEVISPCCMYHVNEEKIGETIESMRFLQNNVTVEHGADTQALDIRNQGPLVLGTFAHDI